MQDTLCYYLLKFHCSMAYSFVWKQYQIYIFHYPQTYLSKVPKTYEEVN